MTNFPLIPLSDIGEAMHQTRAILQGVLANGSRCDYLRQSIVEHVARIDSLIHNFDFAHQIGDLIEFKEKDGTWSSGCVVAYMIASPNCIVTAGDVRDPLPENANLWGVSPNYIRPRRKGHD